MRTTREAVAQLVFGWNWFSHMGIPVRDTPGYPNKMRVREFCSPGWLKNFPDVQIADGTEPLAYCYVSSRGPQYLPNYLGDADIEVLTHVRMNWNADDRARFEKALGSAMSYKPGNYSRAALKVLRSKNRKANA